MPAKRLPLLLAALLALAALCATATTAAAQSGDGVRPGALYDEGQAGRYLLGGDWLLRKDPSDEGQRRRFERQTSEAGWETTSVPRAWNAGDDSNRSMAGGVASSCSPTTTKVGAASAPTLARRSSAASAAQASVNTVWSVARNRARRSATRSRMSTRSS